MRFIITLLLAAAVSPFAVAAPAPAWTAQGVVTRLKANLITVHGHTCELAGLLGTQVKKNYEVGDGAKIACTKGALRRIATLPLTPVIVSSPKTTSTGPVVPSIAIDGTLVITAVDNMSISVNTGLLTCVVGTGSPDVSSLQVGDHLTSMRCSGNPLMLTAFTT